MGDYSATSLHINFDLWIIYKTLNFIVLLLITQENTFTEKLEINHEVWSGFDENTMSIFRMRKEVTFQILFLNVHI